MRDKRLTRIVNKIFTTGFLIVAFELHSQTNTVQDPLAIGLAYCSGEEGYVQDFNLGFKWLAKAAEQSNQLAQLHISQLFKDGAGVPQNKIAARKILHKLASENYALAQVRLGMDLYFEGQEEETVFILEPAKNQPKLTLAYKWFALAAQQDDTKQMATKLVGDVANLMSSEAIRNAQSMVAKFKATPRARLDVDSKGIIEPVELKIIPLGQLPDERLLRWQLTQASNNVAYSQFDLGQRYLKGTGVATNEELALYWIRRAATNGSEQATNFLKHHHGQPTQ